MVSILPQKVSPWQIIGQAMSQLGQNAPQMLEERFKTQRGLGAVDQLQEALGQAGGDVNKILPALARAYTLNPNLERSGLGQQYLQQARVAGAFPSAGKPTTEQPSPIGQPSQLPNLEQQPIQQTQPGTFAEPSPFNIFTPDQMRTESERYATVLNDPNAYNQRFNQLQGLNEAATAQRQALEDAALKANVKPEDLSRFMVVNSKLDPRNPSKWAQEGVRNFNRVKANDQKIRNAFIPGIGNALMGMNRQETLNRMIPALQENKKMGLEQEDRNFLADNYLTQAEIESLYHPLTPKHEKSIKELPKGVFPARTGEELSYFAKTKKTPFISYEEAREKDPKALQVMQDRLSNFFLKNVDNDTSLLTLREKLWKDKDYDWRQIGPALREAQEKGLVLNPEQEREAITIDTQAPIQSLPELFQDFSRIPAFIRGNK